MDDTPAPATAPPSPTKVCDCTHPLCPVCNPLAPATPEAPPAKFWPESDGDWIKEASIRAAKELGEYEGKSGINYDAGWQHIIERRIRQVLSERPADSLVGAPRCPKCGGTKLKIIQNEKFGLFVFCETPACWTFPVNTEPVGAPPAGTPLPPIFTREGVSLSVDRYNELVTDRTAFLKEIMLFITTDFPACSDELCEAFRFEQTREPRRTHIHKCGNLELALFERFVPEPHPLASPSAPAGTQEEKS